MKTKSLKDFAKQIEIHKDAIAKERDALRALLDYANEVCDLTSEALEALESAVDTISQQL